MDFQKIITGALCCLLLFSCSYFKGEKVSKSEYDDLMNEYVELKDENQSNKKEIMAQAAILNNTLQELSAISNRTVVLRQDVEHGQAKISQADNLQGNIQDIKQRIADYEKIMSQNSGFKKTIANLKKMVDEKEEEILSLKEVIAQREAKIQAQSEKIQEQGTKILGQSVIISNQSEELKEAFFRQLDLIYQAGVDFEEIAQEDVIVRSRKNKAKVSDYKKDIMNKAIEYYKAAAKEGHSGAIERLKALNVNFTN